MYPVRIFPSCFLSHFKTQISNIFPINSLWVSQKLEKLTMHVNWKALLSLGCVFWGLMCCTDLLGESTWKQCSHSLEDILNGQYNEINRLNQETKPTEIAAPQNQKMNWSVLLWNVCAFLCSLVFCSVLKSMSWIIWKLFRIYNVFRNRASLTNKLNTKITESEAIKSNCKVIFKNQLFAEKENVKMQEQLELAREIDDLRKEKSELAQQLVIAQKENLSARQQIEEFKLETFMMKEKLARTASTLKENLKFKDFANANQEMITRKAHNLEMHLKEVSRDRDILRTKLSSLEKSYSKLEDRLKSFEKEDSETNLEQYPEKDTDDKPVNEFSQPSEAIDTDVDVCKFQKKIIELQRSIGTFETKKKGFEGNSKISVDLDESSFDTSKDNDCEENNKKKADINMVKQNILNYNAYKAQMLRPKLNLNHVKEKVYSSADTTGSSSDENNAPHRIISSTVEFQNFLKTLASSSSVNCNRGMF